MTRRSLPRRGKRTPPCPGCKMAARVGAAWRGGHVLGSSARASLSDLYGSSRRTGAAERERGRVSSRAEPPLPRKTPLGPVLVFRGFFFLASCSGVPDYPGGSWGVCGWGLPGRASVRYRGAGAGLCGKRPGRSPVRRADLAADVGSVAPVAARPPPRPFRGLRAGRGTSGAPRDVAGARRGRPGSSGVRSAGALLAASRGPCGSSWRVAARLPPISCF